MQLTYIDDIDDEKLKHLNIKYKVTIQEIQRHFNSQLKKFIKSEMK